MRRGPVAIVVLVAPLLTSGCTVPARAVAGVGVDADGRVVGYLRVCSHHLDGASLYRGQDDRLGSWTAPGQVTDFTSWTLASPPSGWTADPPLARLQPDTEYTFYGWTSDDSSSAVHVRFVPEQLAELKPGQVRYWSGSDSHGDVYQIAGVEEFRRSACTAL